MKPPVLIIAEAGVNHNGSLNIARDMVDAAADAGADIVKFQTFTADAIVTRTLEKAAYQKERTAAGESQYQMIKRLELARSDHEALILHCSTRDIEFLSTPFDLASIDLLVEIGVKRLKIPSGELTNLPYLQRIGKCGKPVILSTGMATLDEISSAVDVLEASGLHADNLTILHCNTAYPTPMEDVNLAAMDAIRRAFGVKVGYSDHTLGIEIPTAAAALGAAVIEKHFTLDRGMPGPDHGASLEPDELKAMVLAIRNVEKAIDDSIKRPSPSEINNIHIIRKSIVATKYIRKGDSFSKENIGIKRPGTGISPMRWYEVMGKLASRDYQPDELIEI